MARKRMIDPSVFDSAAEKEWSGEAILVWMACVSQADDEGRGRVAAVAKEVERGGWLHGRSARAVMDEIVDKTPRDDGQPPSLVVYDAGRLYALPNWQKHQAICRPKPSTLPPPPEDVPPAPTPPEPPKVGIHDASLTNHGTVNDESRDLAGAVTPKEVTERSKRSELKKQVVIQPATDGQALPGNSVNGNGHCQGDGKAAVAVDIHPSCAWAFEWNELTRKVSAKAVDAHLAGWSGWSAAERDAALRRLHLRLEDLPNFKTRRRLLAALLLQATAKGDPVRRVMALLMTPRHALGDAYYDRAVEVLEQWDRQTSKETERARA